MGGGCSDSQYRDPLLKKCVDCRTGCQLQPVPAKCTGYCDSARCTVRPAHYYDPLVKKCLNCMTICGRHPAVCSQHCHIPPPPVPTLQEPTVMLYSLLAVCMLLLFSSLCLALVVLMRERKVKTGRHASAGGRRREAKGAVLPRQEFGFTAQQGKTVQAPPVTPSCPAARVPSDDSIPTETCVCAHCFPDLKTLGHAAERLPTESVPFYQPPAFHGAPAQNGGPLWAGESHLLLTSGPKVQADTAVG